MKQKPRNAIRTSEINRKILTPTPQARYADTNVTSPTAAMKVLPSGATMFRPSSPVSVMFLSFLLRDNIQSSACRRDEGNFLR